MGALDHELIRTRLFISGAARRQIDVCAFRWPTARKRCMKDPLAYHTVVHALEATHGWTEERRFALAVQHCIQGHLPYARYHTAGKERRRAGIVEEGINRLVRDFLETDINPAVSLMAHVKSSASVIAGYNAYNVAARLGVRTIVSPNRHHESALGGLAANRAMLTSDDDPAPCRTATLCVLRSVLAHVDGGGKHLHRPKSLSELADFLGLGLGVAADAARAIEDDWLAPLSSLPRKLGCQKRTLERRLSQAGLTAQAMRQADRMMRATAGFFSGDSATAIAFDSGFADAAHMSRAFRTACGMTPTMLMKIARGDGSLGGEAG